LPVGAPATTALPFLVGYEAALQAIIERRRGPLRLPRIVLHAGPLAERVLAVEILAGSAEQPLLLWLQDASELARLEQQVLQQRNELRLAQAALTAARDAAEAAHAAKAAFLANISHDLKSPLQVILGNAQILAAEGDALPPPERQAFLQDLAESGHSLLSMIEDLLVVAALEAGRLELAAEPCDLVALIERTLRLAARLPDAGQRQLLWRPPATRPWLLVDPVRLQRILTNLLTNAIKHTGRQGQVELAVAPAAAEGIAISVADDGCGLAPALREQLFAPFAAHGPRAGSGLGLHIARGLAELHDGSLNLADRPGGGTVATLTLPAARLIEPPP
jgi:signal transduction histidine kinase